ncbi:MAG TPA: hypothetical protein VF773_18350 [Verrucomicrobiae bacterium]
MNLLRFNYWEREPSGEEWEIEPLSFGKFSLIVGRNAAGKTRLLKAIARVAAQLSGEARVLQREFRYELEADSHDLSGKKIWAQSLQYLPFSGGMNLKVASGGTNAFLDVAEVFARGHKDFGDSFEAKVRERLKRVAYPVESFRLQEPLRLLVKQPGRKAAVAFSKLSQAQQRATTFLSIVTLLELEGRSATLLVDDFGEGLDYESAIQLTKLLLELNSPLQFLLTSNDRYVMNTVPLEHWTVLVEEGTRTRVFNYANSRQKFDDFKFTGLSNFDFFSMDFARAAE